MSNTSFSCHDAQELPPSSKKMLFPSEIGHDDKLVECHSCDCYNHDTKSQISHLTYHVEGYDFRTNDNSKIFHSSKNIRTNQLDNADEQKETENQSEKGRKALGLSLTGNMSIISELHSFQSQIDSLKLCHDTHKIQHEQEKKDIELERNYFYFESEKNVSMLESDLKKCCKYRDSAKD